VLFSWFYFGSPIPATLAAKQAQGRLAISPSFLEGFNDLAHQYAQPGFILFGLLALMGSVVILRRKNAAGLLLAWGVIYTAAYAALGVSRYYWYYAPLVPVLVFAVGAGMEARRPGFGTSSSLFVELSLLLAILSAQLPAAWKALTLPPVRLQGYRQAGEWLALNTRPEARLGAIEIGILGYYARRPVVDFAGLLQPALAARFTPQMTLEDLASQAIETYSPEYLAIWEGDFPNLENGRLSTYGCLVVQRFSAVVDPFFSVSAAKQSYSSATVSAANVIASAAKQSHSSATVSAATSPPAILAVYLCVP
jgi:hypothetical protein